MVAEEVSQGIPGSLNKIQFWPYFIAFHKVNVQADNITITFHKVYHPYDPLCGKIHSETTTVLKCLFIICIFVDAELFELFSV